MNSGRFCFSCWLKQDQIVEHRQNGATAEIVASSWIEPLAGLSR